PFRLDRWLSATQHETSICTNASCNASDHQVCAPLKRSPATVLPHPSHDAFEKYGSYSLPSSGISSTNPITPLIPSPHSSTISPMCASVPSPFAITCTQSGQNSRSSTLIIAIVLPP